MTVPEPHDTPPDHPATAPPPARSPAGDEPPRSLPVTERPLDPRPVHTADLPATPRRDRIIPAGAWLEAPAGLLAAGEAVDAVPGYLRRIGPWLLWRAGPPRGGEAVYWAAPADDLDRQFTFRLHADGRGEGTGPSGAVHERFRTWKEDLRDHD